MLLGRQAGIRSFVAQKIGAMKSWLASPVTS
jgi:hypothetical protein